MANVVGFSRIGDEGKYDVKVCTNQVCEIQEGYYKLQNNNPKEQLFPFPSSLDNSNVFIPERVVEDKTAFDMFVVKKYLAKPECVDIDPCNIYTNDVCCKEKTQETDNEETDNKDKKSMTGLLVFVIILAVFLFGILIVALAYLAMGSSSYNSYSSSYSSRY